MRILAIERDATACNFYRVVQPLTKMKEQGMAEVCTLGDHELGTDKAVEHLLMSDIVLFQRPCSDEWYEFIKICQKYGKYIVCDYDDDPFRTHPLNPFYRHVGTREYGMKWPSGEVDMIWQNGINGFDIERNIHRNDMFRASFKKSDLVTTTTDILRKEFLTMNENVVALPNLIDLNLFKRYEIKKHGVRIGWQGGVSHYEDLYIVRDFIKKVLAENDDATFVYWGDMRFRRMFQEIPTKRIEYHEWLPHKAYPYKLALLNLDIGICPLHDNEFNRNKSCIKFLEYSSVGAATVASNIPPYSPVIEDGETGLLVENNEQWVDAMNRLVWDAKARKKMADQAYDQVKKDWNADKKAHLWRDAYQAMIDRDIEPEAEKDGDDIRATADKAVVASG